MAVGTNPAEWGIYHEGRVREWEYRAGRSDRGLNRRGVQKWARRGELPGAVKFGCRRTRSPASAAATSTLKSNSVLPFWIERHRPIGGVKEKIVPWRTMRRVHSLEHPHVFEVSFQKSTEVVDPLKVSLVRRKLRCVGRLCHGVSEQAGVRRHGSPHIGHNTVDLRFSKMLNRAVPDYGFKNAVGKSLANVHDLVAHIGALVESLSQFDRARNPNRPQRSPRRNGE